MLSETLFSRLAIRLEKMRSLPDHTRKIFMTVSMVMGSLCVGVLSWIMFPPIQDLNPSSFPLSQQQIAQNEEEIMHFNQMDTINPFAYKNNIAAAGPITSFMESFDTVKNLIVPEQIKQEGMNYKELSSSLSHYVANASASVSSILKTFISLILETMEEFRLYLSQKIASYISRIPDLLMPFARRITK